MVVDGAAESELMPGEQCPLNPLLERLAFKLFGNRRRQNGEVQVFIKDKRLGKKFGGCESIRKSLQER